MTVTAFAKRLGVSVMTAWRYENGRVPEPSVLRRIIREFDGQITANDYLDIRESATPAEQAC